MTPATERIRVLCVDDHRIVREGIALIIEQQPDMTVVGAAATCAEAIERFREHRPDVTLMDLQLGERDGVEAIAAIREDDPGARIVVLTVYVGDEDIHRALSAGATTYLYKNTLSDDLIRTIREVYRGERPPMSEEVIGKLREREGLPRISPREIQILELIAQGLRDREIAEATGITEQTVHVHVKNILAKLEARDRMGAVRAALRRGIIHI